VLVADGEVDAGLEDNSSDDDESVGGIESEMVSGSKVVEIEFGCAVSTEDGTGIEDVNSETGDWNEPLIRSSLRWRLSRSTAKAQRVYEREARRKCHKRGIR
jgi:hypothetical protein